MQECAGDLSFPDAGEAAGALADASARVQEQGGDVDGDTSSGVFVAFLDPNAEPRITMMVQYAREENVILFRAESREAPSCEAVRAAIGRLFSGSVPQEFGAAMPERTDPRQTDITIGGTQQKRSSLVYPVVAVSWGLVHAASIGLSAYHGTKRNGSIFWGAIWGAAGGLFPIVTPAVAVAQGFARKKGKR